MSSNFLPRHYNAMTGFPSRVDNLVKSIEPWVREWTVKHALDAGCGGGALMFALDRLGVDVVGLDYSESMLRLALDNARRAGKSFRFCGAPFRSAAAVYPSHFDAVFVLGNALIGHETDADMLESLRGLRGALKPGGRMLIQNLNVIPFMLGLKSVINRRAVDGTLYLRYAVPVDTGRLLFSAIADGPGDIPEISTHIWTVWSRQRLQSCLERAGFTQIEVFGSIDRAPYDARISTDLVFTAMK